MAVPAHELHKIRAFLIEEFPDILLATEGRPISQVVIGLLSDLKALTKPAYIVDHDTGVITLAPKRS